MSQTQIVAAPQPERLWYAAFPDLSQASAEPGDTQLGDWIYTIPPTFEADDGTPKRPGWRMGSTGPGTGGVKEYAVRLGVPCIADSSTGSDQVYYWSGPTLFGTARAGPAGFNPGYVSRENRVLRVRFGHVLGAGTVVGAATPVGVGLFVTDSGILGGTASMPSGGTPRLMASVECFDDGGVQGLRYRAYDAAGAELEAVPLDVPDVELWSTFTFEAVAASAGRPPRVTLFANGAKILTRDADGVLLEDPQAFAGGAGIMAYAWGNFYMAGGLAAPPARWLWWEATVGRFTIDGVEIRS